MFILYNSYIRTMLSKLLDMMLVDGQPAKDEPEWM